MGLSVLNDLFPGDKLEMHYINSQNKDLILETLIYDVVDEDEILIHNPLFEGKLYMIPLNVEVTAFTKKAEVGVIAFSILLLKREKKGNVYTIRCKINSELQKQQRRHYYRVRMFTDMDVYCMVDVQGHPVDYYIFDPDAVDEQKVDFKVSVLDISGGGVGLRSRIDLPIGTYIYGEVHLASRSIEVVGVIVRSMPSKKYLNEFELGVMFKDLDHENTRIITSYVFRAQQEARRKELKHAKD